MTKDALNSPVPVVCVIGSWSSGTSAVAGYLAHAGAYACPPHYSTNDPRTPMSFEPLELRAKCLEVFDELSLKKIGDRAEFERWFGPWLKAQSRRAADAGARHIVLKHPLLALLIEPIIAVCDPAWVVVTRPSADIEATRTRRKWASVHGARGARMIYSTAINTLVEAEKSYQAVSFPQFLASGQLRDRLLNALELDPSEEQRRAAERWLR